MQKLKQDKNQVEVRQELRYKNMLGSRKMIMRNIDKDDENISKASSK